MLVIDIETKTFGKPNPNKDELRFLGAYDIEHKQYYFLSHKEIDKIKTLFKSHRVLIGFNNHHYDDPILIRAGINLKSHTSLDLREIIKKRENVLNCANESKSLSNMARFFGITISKDELDYDILKKDTISDDELELIKKYTFKDIDITFKLFNHIHEYFKPFKYFLDDKSNARFHWLTTSISSYAYKVICQKCGLSEDYEQNFVHKSYEGGFVSAPTTVYDAGNIYCLDFSSMYPHAFMQGNLYSNSCSCCKSEEKWKGNEMFPIKGEYCSKQLGKIESVIKEFYLLRLKYKNEKDSREYVIKIIINSIYGISGSPLFKSLYNYNTASDCTLISRESIKYARKVFFEHGYKVLYSDTDSVYLNDIYNDREKMLMVKDYIIDEIKKNLPFPQSTFNMNIDAAIKHIYFFKNGEVFLKKHYIYITQNNNVIVKGLSMIKNDSSKIGYLVFNKYMKEQLVNGNMHFDYNKIRDLVYKELEQNIALACRTFKVWNVKEYKIETQIQAQIAKKYGSGVHKLIPNKYYGVGKRIKYCTVEEFMQQGLLYSAIILNKVWAELAPFLNYVPDEIVCGKKRVQEELLRWVS